MTLSISFKTKNGSYANHKLICKYINNSRANGLRLSKLNTFLQYDH